ncbi:MAG: tetratricopeptide repeat protein [Chitinophagaceae bacterium]|nr:tetratricopeptide repeat protein [Chitinophagaceae bacterium]
MQYVNPFGLLEIRSENLYDISSSQIRRAKNNLLANIELSDNDTIEYSGIKLTKSDCIKVIDELDSKDKREFHFFIFKNPDLNSFLKEGSLKFFKTYKVESIYKLPEFLDFISPFFTFQYDKQLLLNYKKQDVDNVKLLLSINPITNEAYKDRCFKGTYTILKEIENELISINEEIKNGTSKFIENNFGPLVVSIRNKVNVSLLNLLPTYFQNIRNQIAVSIRNIEVSLYNDPYNNYSCAFELIELAKNINCDGLSLQTITKSYYIVKTQFESVSKYPLIATMASTKNIEEEVENDAKEAIVDKDKIQEKVQEYKSNTFSKGYLLVSCFLLIWSIYNDTTRTVILSFYAFSYLMTISTFLRKPEEFKKSKLSDILFLLLSIVICVFAYINKTIAIFFLLYHFVGCCFTAYYEFIQNKPYNKNKSIAFLILALIGTYYFKSGGTSLSANNLNNSQEVVATLTDQQYFENGQGLFSQSRFSEAIGQYTKAIQLNPNHVDAFLDRGVSKANLGQYDSAIVDYNKAEELGYKKSILYSNLGLAYYQLKQTEKANEYFEKALTIDSANSYAYRGRGDIKYDQNDNKGAVDDYSLAIQYNPSNASNYSARGLGYYYLKNYKRTIEDLDKAIELNSNNGQYYFDRGDAKDQLKDFNGACNDWIAAKAKGYNVPEYKVNKCTPQIVSLANGELTGCNTPRYNKGLDNKLLIEVGGNASVVVKLIEIKTQRCIRYVFINKSTSYAIRNIPEGKYYLKIAYGDDWSIMQDQPNCSGRFTKNALFKKGEDILDYSLVYSRNKYQIPSFSLKLDIIISDDKTNTFNTGKIDENDFYNDRQ